MVFEWSDREIAWYERAVRMTGFDDFLYEELRPYLRPEETICDLGCGIGYLSRCLCRHGFSVTAIDRSENAIRYLTRCAAEEGLNRLIPRMADWTALPPEENWDTILMCFAGQMQVDRYPFRKRLIILQNERHQSQARPDDLQRFDREAQKQAAWQIDPARYTWHYRHLTREFGQPLHSPDEGMAYLEAYHYPWSREELMERLVLTGDDVFPFYLPRQKEIGMYVIERRE